MLIPTYTEEFRQRELERGRRSLFYFAVSILGFSAPDRKTGQSQISEVHRDLCAFLEGRPPHHPWRRGLVCCARGIGKSVLTTQAYPMWRGLYIPNFSTKIIENSADNAKRNHFIPIVDLFTTSPRADYLQWLFEHRIPPGFAGWTTEQIKLVQTDPLANPCLSYWGIESKFEGAHPDLAVGDDLEGADADKSYGANAEAWRAYQALIPLLKHPTESQVLLVATPHGHDPLVWKIRDREKIGNRYGWASQEDNAESEFKIFWRPILNDRGESVWPERFPLEYIESLSREDIFPQQYMLRRATSTISLFDMVAVQESCYSWHDSGRDAIVYPGFDWEPGRDAEDPHYCLPKPVERATTLGELRYYLHYDPLHKAFADRKSPMHKQRPAEAAMVVVGVTADFHAICVDYWHGDGDIDRQVDELFRLYRIWCPAVVTFEAIAAQAWVLSLVKSREKQMDHWRQPRSTDRLGTSIPLPALSSRMIEADKTTQSKEQIYREVLSSWANRGLLHFRREQEVILHQLNNVLNYHEAVDLVDCLAQGPKLWAPPRPADLRSRKYHEYVAKANARLQAGVDRVAGWAKKTGYSPPWGGR